MPVYEIALNAVSQAYLEKSTIINPALEWLSKRPGVIQQWLGVQIEDGNALLHVIEWETHAHIEALDKDPEFQQFLELVKPSVTGPPKIYTINFDHPADATLNAPITEFCTAKVKDTEKSEELTELLKTLGKQLTAGPGCYGPAPVGTTKQEEGTDIILIGWDTVQTHVDAVSGDPGVEKLLSLANLEVTHAAMRKY